MTATEIKAVPDTRKYQQKIKKNVAAAQQKLFDKSLLGTVVQTTTWTADLKRLDQSKTMRLSQITSWTLMDLFYDFMFESLCATVWVQK